MSSADESSVEDRTSIKQTSKDALAAGVLMDRNKVKLSEKSFEVAFGNDVDDESSSDAGIGTEASNDNELSSAKKATTKATTTVKAATNNNSDTDYHNLNKVTSDVREELFQYVEAYEPNDIEIVTPSKSFIPPYIPAAGEVDPMVKIDGVDDGLGIQMLDEIPSKQGISAVIELQLQSQHHSKKSSDRRVAVRSINDASRKPNEIDEWVQSVEEIHASSTPSANLRQLNGMPSMEELMQSWPDAVEEELKKGSVGVPSADIDLSLSDYVRVLCSLLGIPIYDGCLIESVHTMISLLVETREVSRGCCRLLDESTHGEMTESTYAHHISSNR